MRVLLRASQSHRLHSICLSSLLLLALALSACGQTTAPPTARATTPAATATPGPTDTPAPTATPTPVGGYCSAPGAFGPAIGKVGDLAFDAPRTLDMYPALKLPDGIALAPLKVDGPSKSASASGWPVVNIRQYVLNVCNTSTTASHVLRSVSVRLDAFTPYTSQLNVTRVCATAYTRQGMAGGGCGGGMAGPNFQLTATFASSAVGTVASTTLDNGASAGPPLVTIAPGRVIQIWVTINPPADAGTYAFRIGFALDGAATAYPTSATPAILQAPVAHEWNGDACLASSMQSQIPPATTPATYYICPKA